MSGGVVDRRDYLTGALAAREFLRQTQLHLHLHRRFQPAALRETIAQLRCVYPPAYVKGFLDAISAYLLITLEGCLIDPQTWDVLSAVDRG